MTLAPPLIGLRRRLYDLEHVQILEERRVWSLFGDWQASTRVELARSIHKGAELLEPLAPVHRYPVS